MEEKKHWQLSLSSLSLKKNKKIKKIVSIIKTVKAERALEIGCDKGVISYHLRNIFPFKWTSCDTEEKNITATAGLVNDAGSVFLIKPDTMPFKDKGFDFAVCIDLLEHLENDTLLIREVNRVISEGDTFLVTVPNLHPLLIVNYLAKLLGVTKEYYSHVRDGYSFRELKNKLEENGFIVEKKYTAVGVITEFVEFSLNFAYSKFINKDNSKKSSKGKISISDRDDYQKQQRKLRVLGMIYPFMYVLSMLDALFAFLPGYILIIKTRKVRDI